MAHDLAARLRLATSATLLTFWVCGSLLEWPFVGQTNVLLVIPLLLLMPDRQDREHSRLVRILGWTLSGIFAAGIGAAIYFLDGKTVHAFMHSAYFVIPMWALAFSSIVFSGSRQSSAGEQSVRSAAAG